MKPIWIRIPGLTHFVPLQSILHPSHPFRLSLLVASQATSPSFPATSIVSTLAYISLQGLLVNSDEASSARSIGDGLSREETLAWELFTPYQRFLLVTVIGVAAAESKKNCVVRQLQKSIDLRILRSCLFKNSFENSKTQKKTKAIEYRLLVLSIVGEEEQEEEDVG